MTLQNTFHVHNSYTYFALVMITYYVSSKICDVMFSALAFISSAFLATGSILLYCNIDIHFHADCAENFASQVCNIVCMTTV